MNAEVTLEEVGGMTQMTLIKCGIYREEMCEKTKESLNQSFD
jgi:hypothetical protein